MTDVVLVGLITASAGIIGATIGVGGTLLVTNRTTKFEERRHRREIESQEIRHSRTLGLQIATAKFEQHKELAQQAANMKGGLVYMQPFESFVVYGIRLMDIVTDHRLSSEEIKSRIDALSKSVSRDLPKHDA